jgi:hypothetical protein
MRYYKTCNFIAVFSLIALAGFIGMLFFWPEHPGADAVQIGSPVLQKAVAKQMLNEDDCLSTANFAENVNVPEVPYPQPENDESQSLSAQTPSEPIVIESHSSDSEMSHDFTSAAESGIQFSQSITQPDSAASSSAAASSDIAPTGTGSSSFGTGGSGASGTSDLDSTSGGTTSQPDTSSGTPSSPGGGVPLSADLYKPRNIANIFYVDAQITQNNRLLSLSSAMNNLNQYDAFWFAQSISSQHPQAWRTLRSEYPSKLALHYVTPFSVVRNPNDSSKALYLDYDYIQQYHPEWFLLKDEKNATAQDYLDPDKRIRWNPDDPMDYNYDRFFLDVGNESFQKWAVDELLQKLDPVSGISIRVRYSGIAADNVLLTVWANSKTALCPNWKYATSASQWNQAYLSYLRRLHDALKQRGYLLIANATIDYSSDTDSKDWQNLMSVVDGLMNENVLAMSSTNVVWGNDMFGKDRYDFWDNSLTRHEEIVKNGLYDWWVFIPHSDDIGTDRELNKFLYIYCSFLLVKKSDRSLFGSVREKDGVHLVPWYEEYTLPLGDPTGFRYQQEGCWMRDYQHGKVVVNPSAVLHTISLNSETYTLDWRTKKAVTRVTLEPCTATILLPTGYSVK